MKKNTAPENGTGAAAPEKETYFITVEATLRDNGKIDVLISDGKSETGHKNITPEEAGKYAAGWIEYGLGIY